MIHFSERIKISGDYYKWIEETEYEHGFRMNDCPITIIAFCMTRVFLMKKQFIRHI